MIECWVEMGNGSTWMLPEAVEWKFCYGTGLPCDSFFLRCVWQGGQESMLSEAALFYAQWDGKRVFTGVVDECSCLCGRDGRCLEIAGRGMAARLLDNEALPVEYQRCTCADMVANHVKPYGIETVGGQDLPVVKGFSVDSGASEWGVVQKFVCYYGGRVPRFDPMGRLVLENHRDDMELELGETAPVIDWAYREQRHGVLSRVAVRRRTSWDTQWIEDDEFLAQGGCARRVVTVPNETGDSAMRYSGDYQLKVSRSKRVRLTVTLAGAFLAWPGQLVRINREGISGVYRVAQMDTVLDKRGVVTTLTFGEKDSMI